MKRLLLPFLLVALLCGVSYANTFHRSMSGKVDGVTQDTVTVSNRVYRFTPQTTFRAHEKKGDSIYEVRAEKSDIRPGQYVVVMANGQIALEVIIARWRQ